MAPTDDTTSSELPGYRRRIRVEPGEGAVLAMLEDDIHCMAVTLRHDGETVSAVEATTPRMPWDTCPGAAAKLVETFAGLPLGEVTAKRDKKQNCTHLHDLAVIAAAHAKDTDALVYDISVSDPVDGTRILEIGRNGVPMHRWVETGGVIIAPPEAAGQSLFTMRDWISALGRARREAARLLQWGALVAHGRTMPMEEQSLAAQLPPNCYTFQPERAVHAKRIGQRFDFSDGTRVPLDGFADSMSATLERRER